MVVGRSTTMLSAIEPLHRRQIHHSCGGVQHMQAAGALFPRHARRAVASALADTRVVVINGARQTGKSTLARLVAAEFPGSELRYLDESPASSGSPGESATSS
jgi:polynucleotide 5'-kinase involved in rRNA processing